MLSNPFCTFWMGLFYTPFNPVKVFSPFGIWKFHEHGRKEKPKLSNIWENTTTRFAFFRSIDRFCFTRCSLGFHESFIIKQRNGQGWKIGEKKYRRAGKMQSHICGNVYLFLYVISRISGTNKNLCVPTARAKKCLSIERNDNVCIVFCSTKMASRMHNVVLSFLLTSISLSCYCAACAMQEMRKKSKWNRQQKLTNAQPS